MNKVKKVKIIIALLLVISLVFTYFIMYYNVNALYPQNKKTIYKHGERFVTQNAEVTITDSALLKKDDIESDKELLAYLKDNTDYLSEADLNLALTQIVIKNLTKEPIIVDLTAFHFESGSFSSQFYYPLMIYYNDCGMYIELDEDEEKVLTVPIVISSGMFLNYSVENIENRSYYLVCSLYPEKIMAEVKFNDV